MTNRYEFHAIVYTIFVWNNFILENINKLITGIIMQCMYIHNSHDTIHYKI